MLSPLVQLQTASYGGRGFFSTQLIPKDTLVHTCPSPYAFTISRPFRKEVCTQCFAYAFDANRNTWNIKSDGVWFCSEMCRSVWLEDHNVGGLMGLMNVAVDKLAASMKKSKASRVFPPTTNEHHKYEDTQIDITQETLDIAWKNAEQHCTNSKTPSSVSLPQLDDMELDTVRFAITAIIKRYIEDTADPPVSPAASNWIAFLQLQNNELVHVRARPHMLGSHLRVYNFLRRVLLPVLQVYVETSETVRAIFGRDPGNVFGLWDMSIKGDSEMLGWGMYVSGSYFNHSCAPNVRKVRTGRALHFYTTVDVEKGEELYINYVDVEEKVGARRAELFANWYFDCLCRRCEEELGIGSVAAEE